jgi:hypothetical protein
MAFGLAAETFAEKMDKATPKSLDDFTMFCGTASDERYVLKNSAIYVYNDCWVYEDERSFYHQERGGGQFLKPCAELWETCVGGAPGPW